MSILKVNSGSTTPQQIVATKNVNKKNNAESIDSSEKIAKSISVESEVDTARVAKLDSLAEQIKNKTFTVSHDAIAEKMLQDKGMINLLLS